MKDVYIIIPVFKGLKETADCLRSVQRNTSGCRIVVINDNSPDAELGRFLQSFAQKDANILLLENRENKGFVKSVNLGLAQDEEKDVIILNNDTIVTSGWVEKLRKWAYSSPDIATVTPISNNATICSYPRCAEENDLPDNLTPDQVNQCLEASFSSAFSATVDLPTGVGFCLYIRRRFLSMVGRLDEEMFDKGYGEENDFCLRCTRSGGRHLVALDTFVFHHQSVSFGNEERNSRTMTALEKLRVRYPEYDAKVRSFLVCDPLWPLMRGADFIRFTSLKRNGILFVDHGLGGGTARHIRDLAELYNSNGWRPFILKPFPDGGVSLESGLKSEAFLLILDSVNWMEHLEKVCQSLNILILHFHHVKGYPKDVFDLPGILDLPYQVTLHDYYAICPRTNGFVPGRGFCGFPTTSEFCEKCVSSDRDTEHQDSVSWRKTHGRFLKNAQKVISPSEAVKTIYLEFFPSLKITVAPHPEVFPEKSFRRFVPGEMLNIGLIGGLSEQKGRDVLARCVAISRQKELPIRWVLMGSTDQEACKKEKDFIISGPFNGKKDLARLVEKYQIHLVVIPALWPETYSYVLSEAWWLGLPVLAPDIGAFSERIPKLEGGVLLPRNFDADKIIETALTLWKNRKLYETIARAIENFAPARPKDYWKDVLHGDRNQDSSNDFESDEPPFVIKENIPETISNLVFSTHVKKMREVAGLLKKQLTLTRNHERNLESFIREIHDAFHSCKTQHLVLKGNIENLEKTNKGLNNKIGQLHHQIDQLNDVIRKYKIHWVINAKTFIKYNLLRRKDNG